MMGRLLCLIGLHDWLVQHTTIESDAAHFDKYGKLPACWVYCWRCAKND
mgnify:CR=1 FL=1